MIKKINDIFCIYSDMHPMKSSPARGPGSNPPRPPRVEFVRSPVLRFSPAVQSHAAQWPWTRWGANAWIYINTVLELQYVNILKNLCGSADGFPLYCTRLELITF